MARFTVTPDVKVVVLTLRRSLDRQARIKKALEAADVEFEFFFGVDGRVDSDPCLNLYDKSKRLKVKGQPMTAGQLGCFASHYRIWKSCAASGINYIVLEDDVIFDESLFKQFLQTLDLLPPHFECIKLFDNKTRNHKAYKVSEFGPFSILRYTKGPMSTMGYFLTPNGARKFLASADPIFLPVDIYMDRYWVNGVACLGVSPGFVSHDYGFASTIGYEQKIGRRPRRTQLNRELFALTERTRRFLYNLRTTLKPGLKRF